MITFDDLQNHALTSMAKRMLEDLTKPSPLTKYFAICKIKGQPFFGKISYKQPINIRKPDTLMFNIDINVPLNR